ncbi:single-stranded-DNA-specific exonuclease RecJ [Asaccharospora irregularis]|uniref:Single-stranded-DNA-specific exonuclease RecJ n=1 Tax=Asaccharospora irregularis DSM 2635 TaxID=1121321 RepID=A0A1M5J7W5_9FIRM|nr:single-stranded-DNA-specific exonuclease RecJ [Asaccharospora irregularis]SHG36571.1 exonuclease RecJ [Asaccharospora irregularis DSM 2635]
MKFNKKWTLKHKSKIEKDNLSQKINISPEISQILKNRGIDNEKDAEIFMNPSLDYLRDPFLMKDMDKAVDRIKFAVENNQRIWIYGDYDVDGVSSTSILCIYFKSINYPVNYYIPNRLEEGYGINEEAIKKIHSNGCDLIISVDCGITSVNEVELANKLGIDVIITDHHECQEKIPNAFAVINPKQNDCNYPFDMLCGCGVAFKIIQALTPKEEFKTTMYDYLEIVTIATICDIVPLVDENRIIVKNGLKLMRDGKNIGLKELIKVCGVESDKIGSSHIGFAIGPRINASGRLGYSYLGVELFTTTSQEEAIEIAGLLEEKNNERQMIEAKMYHEAEEIIKANERYENDKVLVIAKEGWQHGIIGIVASKLTEKYYKPTILLTIEGKEATGSARSIKGFSIFDALTKCKHLMNKFGGHDQAAGLALDSDKVEELSNQINKFAEYNLTEEDMIENISVEFELSEDVVNLDLVNELHKLEPFGLKNPNPRFIIRNCELSEIRTIGKKQQHLKLNIQKENTYECIGFNMGYLREKYQVGDKIDVLFQLDENVYMGNRKVQFLLKDIRLAYPKDSSSDTLSLQLMSKIIPSNIETLYNLSSIDGQNNNIDSFMPNDVLGGSTDINIFEYINSDTLVIANSVNGFYKAISDISLTEYDFSVDYNIIEDAEQNIDKVQLIFSPNIDKIDLKRYNNIILYDYLYNKDEYYHINNYKREETLLIKYYTSVNLLYLNSIINNITPNRDEFVFVYKSILTNKKINMNMADIKKVFNMVPIKLFAILNIFKELSLIDFNLDYTKSSIFIKLLPKPNQKLDLNSSLILNNLEALKNKYSNSY